MVIFSFFIYFSLILKQLWMFSIPVGSFSFLINTLDNMDALWSFVGLDYIIKFAFYMFSKDL